MEILSGRTPKTMTRWHLTFNHACLVFFSEFFIAHDYCMDVSFICHRNFSLICEVWTISFNWAENVLCVYFNKLYAALLSVNRFLTREFKYTFQFMDIGHCMAAEVSPSASCDLNYTQFMVYLSPSSITRASYVPFCSDRCVFVNNLVHLQSQ